VHLKKTREKQNVSNLHYTMSAVKLLCILDELLNEFLPSSQNI